MVLREEIQNMVQKIDWDRTLSGRPFTQGVSRIVPSTA